MSETAKIKPLTVDVIVLVISRRASIIHTAKKSRPASFLFIIFPYCYLMLQLRHTTLIKLLSL